MKKPKKLYISTYVETRKDIQRDFQTIGFMKLVWADGQVGACAVFTSKRKAEKYAGRGRIMICEGEVKNAKVLAPGHGFNSERSQRAENGGRP